MVRAGRAGVQQGDAIDAGPSRHPAPPAARYDVDARASGGEATGSYTGTVGVAWSRSGTVAAADER